MRILPAVGDPVDLCLDCWAGDCLARDRSGRAALDPACPYRRDRHGLHFVGKED